MLYLTRVLFFTQNFTKKKANGMERIIMFMHIGSDRIIPVKSIIAILDLEKTTISKDTKEFLRIAEEEGFIEAVMLIYQKHLY